ncbi:alpha/beta-hydrolase [Laetiporus sulphureus 93-53]|uniref:Alpha/beta-hydrolase n=1 Tax=Laetiporus sulphureus 93-53 TaxID=1314785 RepID=A0A165BTI0_9APHY|nr:alpha/beta-hydrolase [Laetiporus sulphureus 93-53]KZT01620.1 alpha/beta-hydrolase [Laetiporus sulphureus 93-53]
MPVLSSQSYVCDPRPDYPLLITAKCYWVPELASDAPDALTLIVTHGTGYHKEQWEPTFEYLYEHLARAGNKAVRIRDIWSIDCPNHGDAAVLNEKTLQWGYHIFNWEEYARAVHIFLSGLGTGVDVDFSKRNLVGVGHSMGAVGLILCGTFRPNPLFQSFIFAEPMCFPPEPHGLGGKFTTVLTSGAEKRRDIFPSREEALAWLQSRAGFKVWDPKVLRAFVDHGMRDLPTADYPDKTEGVTLKCTRAQEAACYRDHTNTGRVRAYNYLSTLCATYPVHILYGAVDDYIPSQVKDYLLSDGTKGKHASAWRVRNSGHLVVQTQSKGLADGIWAILTGEPAPAWEKSKL